VFHAFLGEKLPDWRSAANLVRKIAENYKLPYYTLSPTYSICRNHGYINGEVGDCPVCGEKTEIYSRITGYYRPVQNWNDGKVQEFEDRKVYTANKTHEDLILIGTLTCPRCKQAEKLLNDAGITFTKILAEDNPELIIKRNIKQAPTLLIGDSKFTGISEIYDYIKRKEKI
jgi:ribonucleoside-triphosphate reductase